ncbi:MAG: hypothetical protein ACLFVR_00295 [Thiohalospira sp.]
MIKKIFFIFLLLTFIACCNRVSKEKSEIDITSEKQILVKTIKLDTLHLDKIESSYLGSLRVIDDSLFFIDNRFCWVYSFDTTGRFFSRFLGQGKGPKELPTGFIDAYSFINGCQHLFIGSSWDCHLYNEDWEREKSYTINWKIEHSNEEMLKNPEPDMPGLYSLMWDKLRVKSYNNYVYLPIESQHPTFNMVVSENYFKNARILAKMNYKTGVVEELLGKRSPVYQEYKNLGHFSYFSYDMDKKGNFYISFEPDSLIYKFNHQFKPLKTFGFAGREMKIDYSETKLIEQFKKLFHSERKTHGYYTWIEYIDETDLLFRAYQKGEHAATDGLQIYQDGVLIADVNVPKGMYIEGYIEPWYYSNAIIDEMNETMEVYRFKLNL